MPHARILCVADEGAKTGTSLIGTKGSSFLIDVDGKKVLFNTGKSGKHLIHNMSQLKLKADDVDCVVISSASLDCIGSLNNFMTNRTVPVDVYAGKDAWNVKRLLGDLITADNIGGVRKIDTGDDWVQLTEHLFLSPRASEQSDETVLVLRTNEGAVVFSSGTVAGVGEVLTKVREKFSLVRGYVGGVRLAKMKQPAVNQVASVLRDEYQLKLLYLNGISGAEGIQKMRVATSKDAIKDFFVGDELDFVV